jgi:hypothetical protein
LVIIISFLENPPIKVNYNFTIYPGIFYGSIPPPQIIDITTNPYLPVYNSPTTFNVTIEDYGVGLQEVLIQFWENQTWVNSSMVLNGSGYIYTRYGDSFGDNVTYRIYVENANGGSITSSIISYQVFDLESPRIRTISFSTDTPNPDEAFQLILYITDGQNASGIAYVSIVYQIGDNSWITINATRNSENEYFLMFPGIPAGSTLKFQVIAWDNAGNQKVSPEHQNYFIVYPLLPENLMQIGNIVTWGLSIGILLGGLLTFRKLFH